MALSIEYIDHHHYLRQIEERISEKENNKKNNKKQDRNAEKTTRLMNLYFSKS